ncbi:MAG: hypothetical protein HC880_07930 [Bacteroidia bacterium]|nr:hypothetical protein [Bacteroidia bacterium]
MRNYLFLLIAGLVAGCATTEPYHSLVNTNTVYWQEAYDEQGPAHYQINIYERLKRTVDSAWVAGIIYDVEKNTEEKIGVFATSTTTGKKFIYTSMDGLKLPSDTYTFFLPVFPRTHPVQVNAGDSIIIRIDKPPFKIGSYMRNHGHWVPIPKPLIPALEKKKEKE